MPPIPSPLNRANASSANTTHTSPTNPTSSDECSQRGTKVHARVPSYEGCQGRYADQGRISPGGPIMSWKHIQASQDAAAMNASRSGSAATTSRKPPDREAWGGRRVVTGAPSGSAAVVSKSDGRRHIVVLCASKGRHLAVAKLLVFGWE